MAGKKTKSIAGIPIKQDAGRLQFPIDRNGKVSILGKKKTISMSKDIKNFNK